MWTVDDEIRDEFAALAKKSNKQDEAWQKRLDAVLTRAVRSFWQEVI